MRPPPGDPVHAVEEHVADLIEDTTPVCVICITCVVHGPYVYIYIYTHMYVYIIYLFIQLFICLYMYMCVIYIMIMIIIIVIIITRRGIMMITRRTRAWP